MPTNDVYDAIIIGAGAAGVGLGVIFERIGLKNYLILERDSVGSSFKKWQPYTRFISPSFTGNFFNAIDLNAITPDTSPAYNLKTEHPSGKLYAKYLELVSGYFQLPVQENTDVTRIEKKDDIFHVHTSDQVLTAKHLVWAGGEFQYPDLPSIPGAELCRHSSEVHNVEEEQATIIGGYESGLELAIHLLDQGKDVTIIDKGEPWEVNVSDSSISIAPFTRDRLLPYIDSKQLKLIGNTEVTKITQTSDSYAIHSQEFAPIRVSGIPIMATGFKNLPPVVEDHFAYASEGHVALTEEDESTTAQNLFLVGPKVQHGGAIFCFIYKFRQRLPIVAETIAKRLDISTAGIEAYKDAGMYLRDLSCCTDECTC